MWYPEMLFDFREVVLLPNNTDQYGEKYNEVSREKPSEQFFNRSTLSAAIAISITDVGHDDFSVAITHALNMACNVKLKGGALNDVTEI